MIKRLRKIGNSHGLILEKGVLDLLGIGPDTPLEVTTDGRRLIIGPSDSSPPVDGVAAATAAMGAERTAVMKAHARVVKKHAGVFAKLAK